MRNNNGDYLDYYVVFTFKLLFCVALTREKAFTKP